MRTRVGAFAASLVLGALVLAPPAAGAPRGCDVVALAEGARFGYIELTQALSSDGRHLVYAHPSGTRVLDADTGTSVLVHPHPGDAVISGDGSTVLVRSPLWGFGYVLERIPATGGTPQRISPDGHQASYFAVDHTGEHVVFDTVDPETFETLIMVWSEGGVQTLAPAAGSVLGYPSISDDGTQVSFTVDHGWGYYDVVRFERTGSDWTERPDLALVEAGPTSDLDGDGSRVAHDWYGHVRLTDVSVGGSPEVAWEPGLGLPVAPPISPSALSPDGDTFLWRDELRSWLTRLGDGEPRAISLQGPTGPLLGTGVSADGTRVAAFDPDGGGVGIYECGDFGDVAPSHPFVDDITWMDEQGISTGYLDGDFRGGDPVSRQAMAAFLFRFAGEPGITPPAQQTFSDTGPTSPFYAEVEWMVAEGLAEGYAPGRFGPKEPVSRQAMAAFLYRFEGEPPITLPEAPSFLDVRVTEPVHPFATEIEWLAGTGIAQGYADGGFHPGAPISRQAMAAFLHRLSDLHDS